MYPGQLETLVIYWTSAVSLPYSNLTIVLLMEVRNCTCSRKILIVNILNIRYIDYSQLQLSYCRF